MADIAVPALTAVLIWWSATGILFWLTGRGRGAHLRIAIGLSGLMVAAMGAVVWLRDQTGIGAAYAGFLAGIVLWAWHEAMFLFGYISGPRKTPCPPGLKTWPRFLVSAETVIHHELAIAAHAILLIAMSWGAANPVAAATFCLLWGMRINAKLVVFLGAPNVSDEVLPAHLTYLSTYFGKRRVTAFFPIFITLATSAASIITYIAVQQMAGSFAAIALSLVSALAWLAVLEHWMLVLPIRDTALWPWANQSEIALGERDATTRSREILRRT